MLDPASILSFSVTTPTSSSERVALHAQLRSAREEMKLVPREAFLATIPAYENQTLLELLDPKTQSLPYLIALFARISICRDDARFGDTSKDLSCPTGAIWLKIINFLNVFDPLQVRYAGKLWRNLLEIVFNGLYNSNNDTGMDTATLYSAIDTMRIAMLRLDPSGSVFTSTHPLFASLCLKHRAYSAALPILNRDIFHIPKASRKYPRDQVSSAAEFSEDTDGDGDDDDDPSNSISVQSGLTGKLTHRPVLSYFLYGAMIYMALGQWKRAKHFLMISVFAPGKGVSKIQLEAMKKLVIVELLRTGRATHLFSPPYIRTRQVALAFKSLLKPYHEVARIFENDDYAALEAEINFESIAWETDNNAGLLAKVLATKRKHRILALRKSFTALPIAEIANRISSSPQETLNILNEMINGGDLKASIASTPDSIDKLIVRFTTVDSAVPQQDDFLRAQQTNASAIALEAEMQSNIQHICANIQRITDESSKFNTMLDTAPERVDALLLLRNKAAKTQDAAAYQLIAPGVGMVSQMDDLSATTAGTLADTPDRSTFATGHRKDAKVFTSPVGEGWKPHDNPMNEN